MRVASVSVRGCTCAAALVVITGWLWVITSDCLAQEARSAGDGAKAVAATMDVKKPEEMKKEEKKFPKWEEVVKDCKKLEGLFPLYYNEKDQKLFMEISPAQLDKEVILPISIARGAGWLYLGGETLNFGNQWIISFRRVADQIHVIRHNVRYKASATKPQADAVKTTYGDSVILSIPVKSEEGRVLVDLGDLFMTDLANLGIMPDRRRSTWAKVKAFPENDEIEVALVFPLTGWWSWLGEYFDFGIPDSRGAQVVVHYGLSMLPQNTGFKTREADDRVGHFLAVVKDFSSDNKETAFVRNVARWNLEKEFPEEKLSPPKKPIIFWIEKSVPREYRKYVREGILEWNKAFEQVGFIDAIEVRDQQSEDQFDPEDIRYNTFRWITTSIPFAMGPSRWNPKTGEILDADILFDESLVRAFKQDYIRRVGLPQSIAMIRQGQEQAWFKLYAFDVPALAEAEPSLRVFFDKMSPDLKERLAWPASSQAALGGPIADQLHPEYLYAACVQRELALIAAVQAANVQEKAKDKDKKHKDKKEKEKDKGKEKAKEKVAEKGKEETKPPLARVPLEYVGEAVREITMHEVGHTLGLRHNFEASTMLSLKECNDKEIVAKRGMSGSIMDYLPANIAPKGEKQGYYFTPTIGPYDYWAIEYAYKPITGDEAKELKKIASRVAEPGLAYATDEDLWLSPDPRVNVGDLGDPLEFSMSRANFVKQRLEDLTENTVAEGEGWQRARETFSLLLGELGRASYMAAQYVGGEYSHRDHRGDPKAREPFQPIPIEKQRQAIRFLSETILSDSAFRFSPKLLRQLSPEYWTHWGTYSWWWTPSYEFDVYRRVLGIQRLVLGRFLDAQVLRSIQNQALHAEKGKEALSMTEVFDALSRAIWSELPDGKEDLKNKAIDITTIRRNLQRAHVERLSGMVLGPRRLPYYYFFFFFFSDDTQMPADARALARLHLEDINGRIDRALKSNARMDDLTRAHLAELHGKITKVLDASLEINEL